MNICVYCGEGRADPEGWHGCRKAQEAKTRIDATIKSIRRNQERPGSTPLSSDGMRHRADAMRDMVVAAKIRGNQIKPQYRDLHQTEED